MRSAKIYTYMKKGLNRDAVHLLHEQSRLMKIFTYGAKYFFITLPVVSWCINIEFVVTSQHLFLCKY